MALDNSTIMGRYLQRAAWDYQRVIPDPVQSGMTATAQALFDPTNRQIMNDFCNWLVQVPSFQYTRNKAFNNGLSAFLKKRSFNGNFMESIVDWTKAHSYKDDVSDLLTTYYPEGKQAYHQLNYKVMWPTTINRETLMTAFTNEYGLNDLITAITQSPINSDNYAMYRAMLDLVAESDAVSPIYTVHYDSAPTTVDGARDFLSDLIAWAYKMTFPSELYNASNFDGNPGIATFSNPSDMVLMVTPEIYGAIGVKGLGLLFNRSDGEVPYRTIVVDEFPVDGIFAILCDESWFQCEDVLYEYRQFEDGSTLNQQYRLHHWATLSFSPFAPIIAFGTRTITDTITVTQAVTGMTLTGDGGATTIDAGGTLDLIVDLTGTVTPETADFPEVVPDSATFSLTAADSTGASVRLGSKTYVSTNNGVFTLHASSALASGTVITVTATSTYKNPSGDTTEYTATLAVTVN